MTTAPILILTLLVSQADPEPPEGETPDIESEVPAEAAPDEAEPPAPPTARPADSEPVEASVETPAEPEEPHNEVADQFFRYSDFVDTRVTFVFGNVNVFAGPGERSSPTSGYRIGVDENFNLFLENVNTRFSGFESLSHLVLYKQLPSFWTYWQTEAALAALVLADVDTGKLALYDSGTYLRIVRKLGQGDEWDTGSVDLTAWPVSADRFRLGYTYLISWGGTAIFPGKLQSSSITEGAVPGVRLRYRAPKGKGYAFVGFKSALLLSREPGTQAGEQVPNYGLLGGGGYELVDGLFIAEANAGWFQKGTQERPGLEGEQIDAFGASARLTVYGGKRPRDSADFRLYRNDPRAPIDYYLFKPYQPGTGYSLSLEGTYLSQNLEDPDNFGSEELVPALAAGVVGIAQIDELTLRLDAFFQSTDFILFNVPGFVPFQAIPNAAKTTPEFFAAATVRYFLTELNFNPGLSVGMKVPATYQGEVLSDQGIIGGADPGEVRTQVIVDETTRIILPPGTSATPVIGAMLDLPLSISESTTLSGELRFELDDNQPRIVQDNERGEVTYFFDKPERLSVALVLQSRW